MSLRSGKLPFLGNEDEFFYHTRSRNGCPDRIVTRDNGTKWKCCVTKP
jgi:hypothetical protein